MSVAPAVATGAVLARGPRAHRSRRPTTAAGLGCVRSPARSRSPPPRSHGIEAGLRPPGGGGARHGEPRRRARGTVLRSGWGVAGVWRAARRIVLGKALPRLQPRRRVAPQKLRPVRAAPAILEPALPCGRRVLPPRRCKAW